MSQNRVALPTASPPVVEPTAAQPDASQSRARLLRPAVCPSWIVRADAARARRGLPALSSAMRYWLRPTPARVDEAAAEALTRAAAYRVLLLSLARKPVQLLPPEPPVEPRPLVDQLLDALTVCPCAPSRPAAA